ncbi:DNA mismatch endonuclease Vsr [Burkholderia cenocepacia]|nr:very short patch repair endonuclease [Burkholderia sp. AU28863]RQU21601.1 DNA mismatch endonuclease Vsr [Burkholderia cenocepacia]RQU25068.1 DNA mismatch endonuclease Vsr [Burkholderia cenocepacia]HDR9076999.1 DNA mismatch endonuclease Vsr [Burkholderia vietnamiensis]HDR9165257.1 DNA mismatch endonuclease Vsr [Burkholderia vietnamiensis]
MCAYVQLSAMLKSRKHRATSLSERMRRIRSRDTAPEWIVRRTLWRMGYRYRLHVKSLPGTPDIVFARRRKAVFVHGCFWHQHGCSLTNLPKTNIDYWHPKLHRNIERDAAAMLQLEKAGWSVLVVWECESALEDLPERLRLFLDGE